MARASRNVYTIAAEYRQWKREQIGEERRWRARMKTSSTEMMEQIEQGRWLSEYEPEVIDKAKARMVEETTGKEVSVVGDIMLGKWESAEAVWAMQAEAWMDKCTNFLSSLGRVAQAWPSSVPDIQERRGASDGSAY